MCYSENKIYIILFKKGRLTCFIASPKSSDTNIFLKLTAESEVFTCSVSFLEIFSIMTSLWERCRFWERERVVFTQVKYWWGNHEVIVVSSNQPVHWLPERLQEYVFWPFCESHCSHLWQPYIYQKSESSVHLIASLMKLMSIWSPLPDITTKFYKSINQK